MHGEGSETQRFVLDLWERTLGIEGIHPSEDFFELGGDSLLALRMLPPISEHAGKDVDVRFILDNPTPVELATAITSLREESRS